MVAGYHHGDDTGGLALGHGLPGFLAGRVNEPGKADEAQVSFDGGRCDFGGQLGQQLRRVAQHPKALGGQLIHAPPQFRDFGLLAGIELVE